MEFVQLKANQLDIEITFKESPPWLGTFRWQGVQRNGKIWQEEQLEVNSFQNSKS